MRDFFPCRITVSERATDGYSSRFRRSRIVSAAGKSEERIILFVILEEIL